MWVPQQHTSPVKGAQSGALQAHPPRKPRRLRRWALPAVGAAAAEQPDGRRRCRSGAGRRGCIAVAAADVTICVCTSYWRASHGLVQAQQRRHAPLAALLNVGAQAVEAARRIGGRERIGGS